MGRGTAEIKKKNTWLVTRDVGIGKVAKETDEDPPQTATIV
jgi:hypothetical protein